jgi:transcriptional regulator with XRE-family HTH domain
MGGKRANNVDVAVGHRIRLFRLNAGLSQTELADQIGVTFQQVQKYEKGVNRVGAGRLTQIAAALNVPITAFFEGMTSGAKSSRSEADSLAELMTAPRAFKLLDAFSEITDPALQTAILSLVQSISSRRSGTHK